MQALEPFGLTLRGVARVLESAMARGGDFADIFCENSLYHSLVLEEGIVKTATTSRERGVGVRVVKGENTGYAYTEVMDESHFLQVARTAAAIAESGKGLTIPEPVGRSLPQYYDLDDLASDVSLDQLVRLLYLADAQARSASERVIRVTVTLADSRRDLVMADTSGRCVHDVQPMVRFGVSALAENQQGRQQGTAGDGGRRGLSFLTDEYIGRMARAAVNEALILLEAQPAPAGLMPVILAPGDSGILLHEAIGHPFEADFNRKKTSAYAGRMGEQVADSQCTIVDDGTVPLDRGSINVDDELNPSQRTVLIEQGRLVSYMYDEVSARYFKTQSTGNGRRESYQYQPLPRMRTTYMLPGEHAPDDILSSTERGIYCKTFRGGQVDISNGNFIFVPSEAYLVEKGRCVYPVKNLSLIGNGPDVLSKVCMVGNDFAMSSGVWTCGKGQSVPVGVGLPTIKISEMTVGGQAG